MNIERSRIPAQSQARLILDVHFQRAFQPPGFNYSGKFQDRAEGLLEVLTRNPYPFKWIGFIERTFAFIEIQGIPDGNILMKVL